MLIPELSAREIVRLTASGELSARAVVRCSLDAIAAENDKLHAFVEVFADGALLRADELDVAASRSGAVGPLHGVPIAVKDLAQIGDRSPGFGSKCYAPPRSSVTAGAIQRLIDAGAVIIGMTHMVEFAIGGWGTNHAMGTPRNRSTGLSIVCPGDRAAARRWRWRPGWCRRPSAQTRAGRSAFQRRCAGSSGSSRVTEAYRWTEIAPLGRRSTLLDRSRETSPMRACCSM